jgi:hypothetical protein
MNQLDEAAKKEFSYGGGAEQPEPEEIKTGEDNG